MTPEQEKVHFDTFGFIIKRGLFRPEETEMFSRWFDESFAAQRGAYDGTRQIIVPALGLHPGFCDRYLDAPRILGTLENLMGEGFLLAGSDAQKYAGNSRWHQDTIIPMEVGKAGEYLMVKVAMYLDDLSAGPGCLWLIPGTHLTGYREALRPVLAMEHSTDAHALTPAGVTPTTLPGAVPTRTRPGDIIFFNQKCFHASWGGQPGRRLFAMTFGGNPTEDWHLEWLTHHAESCRKSFMKGTRTQYPEHLVQTTDPRRRQLFELMHNKGY